MMSFSKSILLALGLVCPGSIVLAQQAPAVAKKENKYSSLFKNKTVKTVRGMITLHKVDGKLLMEFPVKLLGRHMLLGSVADAVSHSDDAAAGEQAHDPLCINFVQADSNILVRRSVFNVSTSASDLTMQTALNKNNLNPVMGSYKILALSPDTQSVVFDATSLFVNGSNEMDPFMPVGGLYTRKAAFKSDLSMLADVMAYEDNVTVSCYMTYGITSTFFGFVTAEDRPGTVLVKRSMMLLPETPMRPRLNDPRIGVFYTEHMQYTSADNGARKIYLANRWRLEPKDETAFNRGELTEPVTPVLFYVDDKFPAHWIPAIRQGVDDWNKAFEKIGFKNAVVTKMYPRNDSAFDPNNIRFNCIKYAPTATQNAMGPSWVDPRSGEILNASVYVYQGIAEVLQDWMFIQMAAVDKRVRRMNLPQEIVQQGMRYVIAHEIGHTLGLMHNMGASAAFPVDSLRSPSFTQKYGTTPSIMDYARFNFVAQPGDFERGVRMSPPDLGVYDYYAIKWLYTPLPDAATAEAEVPTLEKWISEKITDPMYRYSKQQVYGILDPNAQTEDLGDDQVKATRYAMQNLQYIMKNLNGWVEKEDKDFAFRKKTNFAIINIHFYWYLMHVINNIGGIYQYEKYEGDPFPAWKAVPREVQRESIHFILETLENLQWMNNPELEQHIGGMNGNAGEYMRTVLFPYVMRWVANIGLSEAKGGSEAYTRAECVKDVFDYVWSDVLAGKKASAEKLDLQTALVQLLISHSKVKDAPGGNTTAFGDDDAAIKEMARLEMMAASFSPLHGSSPMGMPGNVSGFEFMPRVKFMATDISHIYYQWLLQCREILQRVVNAQTGDNKLQYEYLLLIINKALKTS
ncbi:zinc-dependent metalloprotease [Pseudoflavitalea rhizosphaerae]|uniref:zinc-dependent metalloprotease n=1 Tax=Pseudoflavitalea rhizosphaerae TaxID=1884793 RepID=UPI000F8E075B|nr:zinc-dependent metalloprotease [Pseudoflavitalea rhizosphaerae]